MARWKRAACIVLGLFGVAALVSCAKLPEAPQGITGVWQGSMTDSSSGTRFIGTGWIEETTGNNVILRDNQNFIDGTYIGGHLTLRWRDNVGSPDESIITFDGDRSGNRLINSTWTERRVSDNVVLSIKTGEADYIMHPADLKTNFETGSPGSKDLSEPWWSNPVPDINVTWNASSGRYAISGAATNPNALPVSDNWGSTLHDDFLVKANVGGDLPPRWFSSKDITANYQMFFIKTSENRLAVIRVTNAASGTYEYAYPYGNYAVSTGTNFLHRRRTAGGTERVVSFLQMTDPDTGAPVGYNRMNASTMEVDYIAADGTPYKVPFQGSPAGWLAEFYSGTSTTASFPMMSALFADHSPSLALPTGIYRLRAQDTLGYEYFANAYYDNTVSGVPYVDNATMSAVWDNTSLRLAWVKPSGLTQSAFPTARFVVWVQTRSGLDNNGDGIQDLVYFASIPIDDAGGDTSVTVPSNAYSYLARYAPGDLVWNVQVRIYANVPGNATEVYRHYSRDRVLPGRPDTVTGESYLQLRTGADGTRGYAVWASVDGPMGWNIPFDNGAIASISLLDNTGTPVDMPAGSMQKFGGPYWLSAGGSGSNPDLGLTYHRGFIGRPNVPVGSLAAGVYTIRVVSASGTHDRPLYYPGDQTLPAVSSGTMSSAINDNGSVTLSWQAPAGFDNTMVFTVVLRSSTQDLFPDVGYDEFLYAGVAYSSASTSYSLTIPKYVADYARANYASGQVKWYVQTRKYYLYNGYNANVARTYSSLAAFPY